MQRQSERTSGWPLCLHHWYVLLSFNSAFYCSLGLVLSLLIYSLSSFLPFVWFSFLLEFLSQSSVTSPKIHLPPLLFLPAFYLFSPLSLRTTSLAHYFSSLFNTKFQLLPLFTLSKRETTPSPPQALKLSKCTALRQTWIWSNSNFICNSATNLH